MKRYYGVIYLKSGESCTKGFDSEEKCIKHMKEAVAKNIHNVRATTYMVREVKGDEQFIFGHPKSRDLMQDKKFLKEISLWKDY